MKTDVEVYLEAMSGDISLTQYGPSGSVEAPTGSYAVVLAYLDEDVIREDMHGAGLDTLHVDPKAIADALQSETVYGGDIPEDRTVYALTTMHDSGFSYHTLYATEEAARARFDELEIRFGEWADDESDDES